MHVELQRELDADGEKIIRVAWKEIAVNGYARTTKIIDQKTKRVVEWTKEVSDFKKTDVENDRLLTNDTN